jgi:hypothetical protein
MIRTADWRDLSLIHKVRNSGLCLDSQLAYTRGPSNFQSTVLDLLTPGRSAQTLVDRPSSKNGPSAMGQIVHRMGYPQARITYIGPEEAVTNTSGLALLDELSHAAGERGAHHLIAEVDETSAMFERLREAGFAIYARQRVWHLNKIPKQPGSAEDTSWRPAKSSDEPTISHLYINIVPALVQQVEQPPSVSRGDLTHSLDGDVLGYLDIERGARGVWVQPYLHPAAENVDELLSGFLDGYSDTRRRPLYFAVRSYEGWVGHGLERLGFEVCSDQAVMVKRLAALIRHPARAAIPAVEGTRPEPTTPFAQDNLANSTHQSIDG